MRNYDQWKTSPPEPKHYCDCDFCGDDICEGEEYLKMGNGDRIHRDCFEDYAWEQLDFSWDTADSEADREACLQDKADAERDERLINGEDW